MSHEAAAVRTGAVILGIGLRRAAEDALPTAQAADTIGVLDGMSGLMSEDAHAPLCSASLDFQHLSQFQFLQPRVGEIKRDGDARHTVGREPFVRDPKMGTEAELLRL